MNIVMFSDSIKLLPETEQRRALYSITHAAIPHKMIDLAGETIEVKQWVIAEDVDVKSGEVRRVYYIRDDEGEVYGSISGTFARQFEDMITILGNVDRIKIVSGTSKSGRTFVGCELA